MIPIFIIFIFIFFILLVSFIITKTYFPTFAIDQDVQLGKVNTKELTADSLSLNKIYTTTTNPFLTNNVPPPLTPAVLGTGNFNTSLEGYPSLFILNTGFQNAVSFNEKIPTSWKTNSPISLRLHFTPVTNNAGTLDLRLWYKKAAPNSSINNVFDNVRISKDVSINSENDHLTAIFPEIALLGETDQTILLFALERQANGGDSVDTLNGSIIVLYVEIIFQNNKLGS